MESHQSSRYGCFLLLVFTFLIVPPLPVCLAQNAPHPTASSETLGIQSATLDSLAAELQRYVDSGQIVGAEVLVISNRHSIFHHSFGWMDREENMPMECNTVFNIRSMTKPLISAGIQILLEEGMIRLSNRAAEYLPGFRDGNAANITIEQLLTHRSGLPMTILTGFGQFDDLQEMANAIGEEGPESIPGSRFWYSDAGVDVLGAIIEVVSGTTLEKFLETRLFAPLGMSDTGFFSENSESLISQERIASLYGGNRGTMQKFWQSGDNPLYPFPWGSQGVYSTPQDYARFLGMLLDEGDIAGERLLSPSAVRRMLTPVSRMTTPGTESSYPTGFPDLDVYHGQMTLLYLDREGGDHSMPQVIGYGGSDGTLAWAWPDLDLMVLFFSQSRGQTAYLGLESVLHDLFVMPTEASPSVSVADRYQSYIGSYRADFGAFEEAEFTVLTRGSKLAVDIPGQMTFELKEPDEAGWWTFTLTDLVAVSFAFSPSGSVKEMLLRQTTLLQKDVTVPDTVPTVPDSLQPLLGRYPLPGNQGVIAITYQEGSLILQGLSSSDTLLLESNEAGVWVMSTIENKSLSFVFDSEGRVTSLAVCEIVHLPRIIPF